MSKMIFQKYIAYPIVKVARVHAQTKSDNHTNEGHTLVDGMPAHPVAEPQHQDTKRVEPDKAQYHDDGVGPGGFIAHVRHGQTLRGRHQVRGVANGDGRRRRGRRGRVHHVQGKGAVVEVHLERRVAGVGADVAVWPRGVDKALGLAGHVDRAAFTVAPRPAVGAAAQKDVAGIVDQARAVEGLDADVGRVDGLRVAGRDPRRERHVVARCGGIRYQHERAGHLGRAQTNGAPGDGLGKHERKVQVRGRVLGHAEGKGQVIGRTDE